MSQRDVQRIEAHTGKKPEDLSEEQLEAAINDLDIETQELTDADVATIESAGPEEATPAAVATPTAPAATAAVAAPDYITELKRLAELRDMGVITSEDFEAKKKQLLGI
jgi:hypothetical protein